MNKNQLIGVAVVFIVGSLVLCGLVGVILWMDYRSAQVALLSTTTPILCDENLNGYWDYTAINYNEEVVTGVMIWQGDQIFYNGLVLDCDLEGEQIECAGEQKTVDSIRRVRLSLFREGSTVETVTNPIFGIPQFKAKKQVCPGS